MPTVIDRRRCLQSMGWVATGWMLPTVATAAAWPSRCDLRRGAVVAAWNDVAQASFVGVLDAQGQPLAAVSVPTRAHAVLLEPEGSVLAVARRPGDWLLRWQPRSGLVALHWNDAARRFTGHALRHEAWLYTTETDLASGDGVVVRRHANSLQEDAVWPTQGRDPHDLLCSPAGDLWVANGGIATDASTGRLKDVRQMDSSLVRLNRMSGVVQGQWRLADARLSMRHLALGHDGRVAIALQAEHDEPEQRLHAPLLALWTRDGLCAVAPPRLGNGYAGDVMAHAKGFVVSAPRAGCVAAWCDQQGWRIVGQAEQACALGAHGEQAAAWWCGSAHGLQSSSRALESASGREPLRMDNHLWALR
jgi:uncharacterized protein